MSKRGGLVVAFRFGAKVLLLLLLRCVLYHRVVACFLFVVRRQVVPLAPVPTASWMFMLLLGGRQSGHLKKTK